MSQAEQMRSAARELLRSGEAACVIGYERGPRGRTRPCFLYEAEECERLIWDQSCTHNLTGYLAPHLRAAEARGGRPRLAVVAKPCDARGIHVLEAEGRVLRRQVHVIGLVCQGILEGAGYGLEEGGALQRRCRACEERTPEVVDTLIGEPLELEAEDPDGEVEELEGMSPVERATFWLDQIDRCIRCYACRQVCPMCDCPTCLYERDDSLWVGMGLGTLEKRAFHLGRAYHLAGRCIGCDECQRVCPMDLPIRALNRKLAEVMDEVFDFEAGKAPVLCPLHTVLEEGSSPAPESFSEGEGGGK